MPSKITETRPVIRDINIDGFWVRVTLDATGVHFIRKGDKHREKKTLSATWKEVFEVTDGTPYEALELTRDTAPLSAE